jgi:flavin-dependent dehydrogenase
VTHVTTTLPLGWTVHRERFDEAHLGLVRSLPCVEVIEGATVRKIEEASDRVRVWADDGAHVGQLVIGADGVNSVVSRCLPGHEERTIGFAYEGEATFDQPSLRREVLFDFRKFPRGYGWIFPKIDHYSIGGYVFGGGVRRIASLYDEFCAESPSLAGCATYRRKGHRIPHGGSPRKLNGARVLLAGDAADLVDPLTGEGIYYALRSGQLAAEAALTFLGGSGSFDDYSDRVRREIQDELRIARIMARVLLRHPTAAFFLLLKNRTVCRWSVEILIGSKSYSSLRRDLLRRAWLLPLQFRPGARQRIALDLP